jgi:hypothetical protein
LKGDHSMDPWLAIFQARHALDSRRQPRHGDALGRLLASLAQLPPPTPPPAHPYRLEPHHIVWLSENEGTFLATARGLSGHPPDREYLFRLASIKALLRDNPGWVTNRKPIEQHRILVEEFRQTGQWIALDRIIRDPLRGFRGVTWWTSHRLSADALVAVAYRMGIARNWISRWSVILRCPRTAFAHSVALRVPTVIDAFNQPIFDATADEDNPRSGRAIDLTQPEALAAGVDEYVTSEVDVRQVEVLPLKVAPADATATPHCLEDGSPLLDSLLAYYQLSLRAADD